MATIALQAPTIFAIPAKMTRKPSPVQVDIPGQIATSIRENLTDEELILAICGGAQWAMELLYHRYARYTFALAYRILHDASTAEDIVQEAFLLVWSKASYYQRQEGSVRSWLQTIVHHRAIDKIRSASHRDMQCSPLQTENELNLPNEQPDVWEEAWRNEQQTLIHSALAQIPAEQRYVIELAYFGGFTHVEIAEREGIPLGTVKGRMRLGLQKLRLLLQENGVDMAS
ncbi:MAG: RNA polymerase sigma factor [Ktedonobacteraceae bacterium]